MDVEAAAADALRIFVVTQYARLSLSMFSARRMAGHYYRYQWLLKYPHAP
jgi:hypothetical protein